MENFLNKYVISITYITFTLYIDTMKISIHIKLFNLLKYLLTKLLH